LRRIGILLVVLVAIALAAVVGFIVIGVATHLTCTEHAHSRSEYAQCP
jgi:hypothetical protein